ncbi:hypothetical protein V6Z11_D11G323000 [Gossypium hirsutum]
MCVKMIRHSMMLFHIQDRVTQKILLTGHIHNGLYQFSISDASVPVTFHSSTAQVHLGILNTAEALSGDLLHSVSEASSESIWQDHQTISERLGWGISSVCFSFGVSRYHSSSHLSSYV